MARIRGAASSAIASVLSGYALAVVLACAGVATSAGLSRWLGDAFYFPMLVPILLVALKDGFGPGLLAVVLSVLGFNVFVLVPFGAFTPLPRAVMATAVFAVLAIVSAWLGAAARRARTRAEETLARFDALFESSPVGTALYDRELRHVRVNPALAASFRKAPDDFPGQTVRALVPELADTIEPLMRQVELSKMALEGQPLSGEMPAGSGLRRHWLATYFPVVLPRGQVIGVGGTIVDVTDQTEIADRRNLLIETTGLLHASFDYRNAVALVARHLVPALADWCIVDLFSEDGATTRETIVHSDPAREQMAWDVFRRHKGDIYKSPFGSAFLEQGQPLLLEELNDTILQTLSISVDHLESLRSFDARSGAFIPLAIRGHKVGNLILMMSESGRRIRPRDLEFLEELGRRMALAIDNACLYEQAQTAIQARDDFLSIASHDLRTPLATVKLLLQNMARRAAKEGPAYAGRRVVEEAQKMDRQITRISAMLNVLLDVSRIQQGQFLLDRSPTDLEAIARDSLQRLEPMFARLGSKASLQSPGPIVGQWDRIRLDQIVSNLLSNAAKYGDGKPIEVSLEATDEAATLRVRDHGVGITPEDQELLFRRFERVGDKTAFSGTGLGLWITRRIVEAHGGTIAVESRLGEGSTFVVTLPRG